MRQLPKFNKAIEIDPNSAETYINRGFVYDSKGQCDLVISDYNRAIEINPRFAEAYFNKAVSSEKVGHIQDAIDVYKRFYTVYAPRRYVPYIERAKQKIKELERPA
jgi:tetratricopeptide (TPR) repeat protein